MKKEDLKKLIEIIIRKYLVPITGDDMHSTAADFNNKIKRDDTDDNKPIVYFGEIDQTVEKKKDNANNALGKPYMELEDKELEEMEDINKKDLYRISSADNMQLRYKNWDIKHIDFMGDEEKDDDEILESLDTVLEFVFDSALYPKDKDNRYNKTSNLLLRRDVENPIDHIDYFDDNEEGLNEELLTEYGNFKENTKYTDWSDFKAKLQNAIKTGFKTVDELVHLMDMNLGRYNKIVENMILNWKDSVSKSLLHTIAHIGLQLPKKGDNIFDSLKQQTVFNLVASNGASRRDIYGNTNGVEGLGYLSRLDFTPINNPKFVRGSDKEDEKDRFITIGGFQATKPIDHRAVEKINEIVQYIWLYSFYQHWKLKKGKIKLPKVLYRGIRVSSFWDQKTLKPIIDQIWKKDTTHLMKRKEAIDVVINFIINKGLTKIADGQLLSFTASKPIASYFTNGEGFIVAIDPTKVEIVTSEKTEPLLDQPDYVSNKKEREYIVKIPSGYKFKKEDIIIEDLDYLVAEQNPLSVQFFDHDDKYAEYDLDGHHIKAKFIWNSSGTKGAVEFMIDGEFYESRGFCKKYAKFDPMPTEENLNRITKFEIKKSKW